jgi:hypothetical protein
MSACDMKEKHTIHLLLVLCRKNKVVPAQIHEIQAVMLDNLSASKSITGAAGPAAAAADGVVVAAAVPTGVVDTAFYSSMGMQQFLPQGSHPRDQAEELLLQMACFTQDIAMVRLQRTQGLSFLSAAAQTGRSPLFSVLQQLDAAAYGKLAGQTHARHSQLVVVPPCCAVLCCAG